MRVAWFSPFPPVRSGITAYSLDALAGLAAEHAVDLYVEDTVWRAAGGRMHAGVGPDLRVQASPDGHPLYRAFDFVPRHTHAAYDLVVYQLGNAACHAFMWPYVLRWPGLVVLHDGALHHARAQALLRDDRADEYRAEFSYNHPGVDPRVADYVVAGLEGSPYYLWPMLRVVMERARAVAVHSERLLEELAEQFPSTPIAHVSMGVPAPAAGPPAERSGLGEAAARRGAPITFAAFGLITPEKRIAPVLQAMSALRDEGLEVRLRLVGEHAEHYALWQDVAAHHVADLIEVTGYVDDAALDAELAGADVCLCLRWPTAHESSASWLRCLAAGRPTVITDQLTTVDVPTLDPRHWQLRHTRADAASVFQPPDPLAAAVAVSIELADETHMLRQALRRLASDAHLRVCLGANARAWWAAHHTLDRMQRDYRRVLRWATALPDPPVPAGWPPHLLPDPAEFARSLIAPLGVDVDVLRERPAQRTG